MYKRTIDNRWSFKDADTKKDRLIIGGALRMPIPKNLLIAIMRILR